MRRIWLIFVLLTAIGIVVGATLAPRVTIPALLTAGAVWLVFVVAGLIVLGSRRPGARDTDEPLSCPECGYDLRGSRELAQCSECGARNVYHRPPPRQWSLERMRRLVTDIAGANRRG